MIKTFILYMRYLNWQAETNAIAKASNYEYPWEEYKDAAHRKPVKFSEFHSWDVADQQKWAKR